MLLFENRRRRIAERKSKQRVAELIHVSRVAIAGELTASITHEINQPLTAIRANSDALRLMLKSASPNMREIRAIADDIRRDDIRASEIIAHLRSLLQKVDMDLKPVDLNFIIGEAINLLAGEFSKRRISVIKTFDISGLSVHGDLVQLQQVIVNLLSNAMDAISQIPISQAAAQKPRIEVSTEHSFETAEVTVADTGPGIPSDKLAAIFEPFFTTKSAGMGMGLSISRTIIEAHHGTVFAENRPNGGAVFRIRLPLHRNIDLETW
jgi:C4-dicarboxylate-specific signal transduction histidine kinase